MSTVAIKGRRSLVLIVDDSLANIQLLGAILKNEGYKINAARGGEEALEVADRIKPDLILMDVTMPDMDGFEVCRRLKGIDKLKDIPVIFLTARTDSQDLVKGFEIGAVDYVTKPFKAIELVARVKTQLELRAAKRELKEDLILAARIQKSILPVNLDRIKDAVFSLRYLPLVEVGGDIYDIAEIRPGYIRIFLADATGHGVHAALTTMLIKSEYEKLKSTLPHPHNIFETLNNNFIETYGNLGEFFPAVILDIDVKNKELFFSSAGQAPQYLVSNEGIQLMDTPGRAVGLLENNSYGMEKYSYNKGDRVVLFTDGLFEEFNEENEEFGLERLESILADNRSLPVDSLLDEVMRSMTSFVGERYTTIKNDDITVIGVEMD